MVELNKGLQLSIVKTPSIISYVFSNQLKEKIYIIINRKTWYGCLYESQSIDY